jgi:hypothetical protein
VRNVMLVPENRSRPDPPVRMLELLPGFPWWIAPRTHPLCRSDAERGTFLCRGPLTNATHPRLPRAAGHSECGTVDRILRNLRFDLGQRKVLLVFDEAQHLSIECLETLRELLDQPPHCGLLSAGTHELEPIFTRQALELKQWRSRFHAGQALPGISEVEAATIVHSELGLGLSQRKIRKLIAKSRITDLRNGGQHTYVSARRLFWVIRELQVVANGKSTQAPHQ